MKPSMSTLVIAIIILVSCSSCKILKMAVKILDCSVEGYRCREAAHAVRLAGVRPSYGHAQSLLNMNLFNDEKDMYMMVTVHLGNDKKPVDIVIDTGSSAMWIDENDCGSDQNGLFGDCSSGTEPNTLAYLDGEVNGVYARTSVWLDNDKIESVNHQFTVAHTKTKLMTFGIIGMARGYNRAETFLGTLKKNGLIDIQAFAIYTEGDKNVLVLGGVDQSLIKPGSNEVTVDLIRQNEFFFTLEGSKIGGEVVSMEFSETLVDSGNTLISFPGYLSNTIVGILAKKSIECYWLQESNPMFSQLVCKMTQEQVFPDVEFVIKEKTFTVPGDHMKGKCFDTIGGYFYDDYGSDLQECLIKIEFNTSGKYFTLGKTFIHKVYTTFNLDENTITFAQNN